jgi:hypothetical protein
LEAGPFETVGNRHTNLRVVHATVLACSGGERWGRKGEERGRERGREGKRLSSKGKFLNSEINVLN